MCPHTHTIVNFLLSVCTSFLCFGLLIALSCCKKKPVLVNKRQHKAVQTRRRGSATLCLTNKSAQSERSPGTDLPAFELKSEQQPQQSLEEHLCPGQCALRPSARKQTSFCIYASFVDHLVCNNVCRFEVYVLRKKHIYSNIQGSVRSMLSATTLQERTSMPTVLLSSKFHS